MKRLRDFQAVVLACGEDALGTCRVVAVQGEEAVLQPDRPEALPVDGWMAATLSFEGATAPVLLSGHVSAGPLPETLRFVQGDRIRMPQLRASARLELALPLQVRPVNRTGGRGLATAARTIDLSAGGMLVGGFSAPDPRGRVLIDITLPETGGLSLEAIVVRTWTDRTAVRFEEPVEALGTFVLRCRQEVAKLAARRAAETSAKLSGASRRAA